jgi:hypothetical protein
MQTQLRLHAFHAHKIAEAALMLVVHLAPVVILVSSYILTENAIKNAVLANILVHTT